MRYAPAGAIVISLFAVGCRPSESVAAAPNVSDAARPAEQAALSPADRASAVAAVNKVSEITIPAGTALPVVLDTAVGSDISRVEQPVRGHLSRAVLVRGVTAVPRGSAVSGFVTDATRSGKVKGRAHVAFRFNTLEPAGVDERYPIQAPPIGRTAPATKEKDALEIGAPAAGGAIVGGLLGGGKGAAIGAAAGGGAGTAVVLSTRGKEVRLGRGALVTLRLSEPVTVRVAR